MLCHGVLRECGWCCMVGLLGLPAWIRSLVACARLAVLHSRAVRGERGRDLRQPCCSQQQKCANPLPLRMLSVLQSMHAIGGGCLGFGWLQVAFGLPCLRQVGGGVCVIKEC